ncbi:MAG: ABC transporter ATP-binding protein [Sulfuricella sp.]|jgi:lipopolysaccharide transport system ATP-binding protein
MNDIAISVKNLTKTYRIFGHPGDRIKQALTFGRIRFHRGFTALQDISFEIKKGETVGIIGRNGSGKSTLLQLICGILKPTSGTVQVNGRISALLELGAGFNVEFTGRENVYFQGALMGFTTAQMDERFDDIADFADIGEFIDQPVRIYSSGMFVRLAFAVAISMEPDILVVDEALAVGDARFQGRCFERIAEIRKQGGIILLVTHSLEQVAHFCDRALLLDHGKLLADGEAAVTLTRYLEMLGGDQKKGAGGRGQGGMLVKGDAFRTHPAYNSNENRWGDCAATIEEITITQDGNDNPQSFVPGRTIELKLKVVFHAAVQQPIYGMTIKSSLGVLVLNTNSRCLLGPHSTPDQFPGDAVCVCFSFTPFLDCGDFLLSFGVASETESGAMAHDRRYDAISINVAYPQLPTGDVAMTPRFNLVALR